LRKISAPSWQEQPEERHPRKPQNRSPSFSIPREEARAHLSASHPRASLRMRDVSHGLKVQKQGTKRGVQNAVPEQSVIAEQNQLAGARGIEPPNGGIKIR
jgi:hypothetical protein